MADSPINLDKTAIESLARMTNSDIVGDTDPIRTGLYRLSGGAEKLGLNIPGSIFGAIPKRAVAASVNIRDNRGNSRGPDLRVKLRVPDEYRVPLTQGDTNQVIGELKGIIFPYTPSIAFEHKADYSQSNPMHSNFSQHFYKSSSVTAFSISGKFTVQNEKDALVYLGTVHLLRALTKMRTGNESYAGAPPPVCRLDAYGDFMLSNVPVSISSFKQEIPDSIDFYTISASSPYGSASVPTVSTISVTCIPMYSRAEMQKFSVSEWLNNSDVKKSGIL
jgi:hypothetical protein